MDQNSSSGTNTSPQTSETVDTRRSYGRNRTYFFDIKRSSYGRHYLTISETQQRDGEYVRHRLLINGGDLKRFAEVLTQCTDQIETLDKAAKATGIVKETAASYSSVH